MCPVDDIVIVKERVDIAVDEVKKASFRQEKPLAQWLRLK